MLSLLKEAIKGMTLLDHLHYLSQVLLTYGKTDANVLCLVGDNCGVNQSMLRVLKVPLIGCEAHKFNLAVCKWMSNQPQHEGTIQHVVNVMKKVSTLKVSAQLCKLTKSNPVKQNDTRWSSIYEMIELFLSLQAEFSAMSDLMP
jgi:hypothetical protein